MTVTAVTSTAPAVPFLDLRAPYLELKPALDAAVARVLDSGWYLLGEELTAFESAFASHVGVPHALGLANGLDALELGLAALGVGAGDEVIVPSNTYIATWLAVTALGAHPVPVEPDPATHNIDPSRIAAAITARTKAILPVHLYGQTADMDPIMALAEAHGLVVLEDAAQAHGARYRGRRAGALGHAAAWSFYPGKNLGAFGDAGGFTTSDATVADRVRVARNYGSRVKYVNEMQGTNSRLDDLQAAVLAVKLEVLDAWNARRSLQAAEYDRALQGTPLGLPFVPEWAESAWHLYVVRVPGGARVRTALQAHLQAAGIGTLIHYPTPPHRQQAYTELGFAADQFPIASQLAEEVLSLPLGPHLTPDQQRHVIDALTRFPWAG
jgi:dTDP-4-amino-4,6-dideoxygalactose transaminase